MVSTCVEIRRNMGRAYGGRARKTFWKKSLQSKQPAVSAMAAMPALPSTPGRRPDTGQMFIMSTVKISMY